MNTKKNLTIMAAAFSLLTGLSNAAVITWGPTEVADVVGDVSTNGTGMFAFNLGGSAVTINGVSFAAGSALVNLADETTGSTNAMTGVATSYGRNVESPSDASALSGLLATSIRLNNNVTHTHTITNLTIGNTYELQIFANANTPGSGSRVTILDEGLPTERTLDTNSSGSAGKYSIGTFTANSATQTFTYTGNDTRAPHINAIQLRVTATVPEPSSTALLGLAGIALILRRRK